MQTVTEQHSPQAHNEALVKKQITTLKRNGVPGKNNTERVGYLVENYPHFNTEDMVKLLGATKSTIYTAKSTYMKMKEEGTISIPKSNSNPKRPTEIQDITGHNQTEDLTDPFEELGITSNAGQARQLDVWDEENPFDYTPSQPQPTQPAQQPYIAVPPAQQEIHRVPQTREVYVQQQPVYTQHAEPVYVQQQAPLYVQQQAPMYVQAQQPPQQLQQAPKAPAVYEIAVNGVDGHTVKSLVNVMYGKIEDGRTYRVRIELEEL